MSIMIKDMEMPDSCYGCRMRTDSDFCSAMPKEFCGYTDDIKRPGWCPLIELPSHGRLIDADKLMKKIKDVEYKCIMTGKMYTNSFLNNAGISCVEWWCVEDLVENAPTFLEEEEE